MTAQECSFAYEQLVALLRERRYGWIVSEVEETISLGRIKAGRALDYATDTEGQDPEITTKREIPFVFQKLRVVEGDLRQGVGDANVQKPPRRGRPVEIQKVQEFSPAEKLGILLTAMGRVFVSMPEMASSTTLALRKINPDLRAVMIDDDRSEEQSSIDLFAGAEHRASAERLSKALQLLKGMSE